jgi:hypothetical protein
MAQLQSLTYNEWLNIETQYFKKSNKMKIQSFKEWWLLILTEWALSKFQVNRILADRVWIFLFIKYKYFLNKYLD